MKPSVRIFIKNENDDWHIVFKNNHGRKIYLALSVSGDTYEIVECYYLDRSAKKVPKTLIFEPFDRKELADKFEYNEKYLSSIFKKRAGKSFKEYLTDKRIELAKRILSSERTPIKAVASMVGYEDEYYFMRVFKRKTGFTPKNYRKAFHGYIYKNH